MGGWVEFHGPGARGMDAFPLEALGEALQGHCRTKHIDD
jgi:hypothetical protein